VRLAVDRASVVTGIRQTEKVAIEFENLNGGSGLAANRPNRLSQKCHIMPICRYDKMRQIFEAPTRTQRHKISSCESFNNVSFATKIQLYLLSRPI
jgi:hypothetical protein